jgi:hypothetical protein
MRPATKLPSSILRPAGERGVALILTLAIIALVTLLLIAFVTSMRVESAASKNFNDLIKTREIAQGAIDQAVATIRQATPQRTETPGAAGTFSTYVTFPGVIWTNNNGTYGPVYLYSAPTSSDTTNLNTGYWITGSNAEFNVDVESEINVGWLYVAADGTVGSSPITGHGALVGRFAYWVDDEASKINLNTAGLPPTPPTPDYGTSFSNDVDLTMLLPGLNTIGAAIQSRQATPGFTTIEEVKLADSAPTAPSTAESDFNTNRFFLTTYSSDANYPLYQDDLDAFDRPRLVLSALNIRDVNGSGGGGTNNAFAHLADPVLGNMYSLSGLAPNFRLKYPVVAPVDGLQQIIANIISYQDPTFTPLDGGGTPPVFLGLGKTPYINEVRVAYALAGSTPNVMVTRTVSVELFYLYDTLYTPAPDTIAVSGLPSVLGLPTTVNLPVGATPPFTTGVYQKYEASDPPVALTTSTAVPLPAAPTQVVYNRNGHRLDYAQMNLMQAAETLDPAASPSTIYQGAQAGDPCVNDTVAEWQTYPGTAFVGTLASRNVWQPTGTPAGNPPGGTSPAYPFGADMSKAVIRGNSMLSIGELGYIHRPEPFKHLAMSTNIVGQIPDWAMMDLFTVATPPTTGRININSFINPGFPNTSVRRLVPLNALLNSALSPLGTVPQTVYDDTTRTVGIDTYGMRNGRDGIFDTIGEICEAPGVADNGAVNEVLREAAIRRIANIITVRSSAFTIWVMAQSIKQPPTNLTPGTYNPAFDLITGEVKAQAVVERYENPPGSKPEFRTRYFRYLYN